MRNILIVIVFATIIFATVIYHDLLLVYPLNDSDITSDGTGVTSPEIQISSDKNGVKVYGLYMRAPAKEFSHFTYKIYNQDIYISGFTKPRSILFSKEGYLLAIPLSKGTYNIYYLNSDGSKILMKTENIL